MHCFAAIVGSIGENKMDITRPPLNGYLSEIITQTVNKLVGSMSSLMHCFAAIAGSMREKTKMDITRSPNMLLIS